MQAETDGHPHHTAAAESVYQSGLRLIGMVRYAITDESCASGHAMRLAGEGVDFIQLRMKTSPVREQVAVAKRILAGLRCSPTKLLINGRADVALAAGAHGVHLTASVDELRAEQVLEVFARAGLHTPVLSRSCHTLAEVQAAANVDWILFAPVFEKAAEGRLVASGAGLEALRAASLAAPGRVLALGGVTVANAAECMSVGAAGVAGIRMFAETAALTGEL